MSLRIGSHQFRFFDRVAFDRVFQLVASRAGFESKLGTQSKEPDKVSVSPRGWAWSDVPDFPGMILALNSETRIFRRARSIGPDVVGSEKGCYKAPNA